jgi:hypothetical protein
MILTSLRLKNPSDTVHSVRLYGTCIGEIRHGEHIDFVNEIRRFIECERAILAERVAALTGGSIPGMYANNSWLVYGVVCGLPSFADPQALAAIDILQLNGLRINWGELHRAFTVQPAAELLFIYRDNP